MADTTTIILGGGFGGIVTANNLRSLLGSEHEIILIDHSPHFLVGATKTWVMLGQRSPSEVLVNRSGLSRRGIQVLEHEVLNIDIANGEVETHRGMLRADFIVIALGANLNMGLIPGLKAAAHTFYTLEGAEKLQPVLDNFKAGEIILLIARVPFKCPPAPYEAALLLHDYFNQRGLRQDINLSIYTVENAPMATAGPEIGQMIQAELAKRDIAFHPGKKAVRCNADLNSVIFADDTEVAYDLLIAVPPHEAPKVVQRAGIVDTSGWIPVNPDTLEVSSFSGRAKLFAVGDVTRMILPGRYDSETPLALPKAGVMADAQGHVVAQQIASLVNPTSSGKVFDGVGVCFLETGEEKAIKAEGHFFAEPHPVMASNPPRPNYYQEKLSWIEDWLTENLR